MIIKTDHGTIKSDLEGFYLKGENTIGREITLGDWDKAENYHEIPESEMPKEEVPEN